MYSLLISSGATLICVGLNYLLPKEALGVLMSLVVAALVINWAMISLTHLKFRAEKVRLGEKLVFKAFWYPFSNYICLAFMVIILYILGEMEQWAAVILAPSWVVLVGLGYIAKKHLKKSA